jgi:hypothetical protein
VDQRLDNPDEYRSVSPVAIIAVILGVASLVVLISDEIGMWALPVAAIVAALAALRQIATATPPRIGRRLAWIALALGSITLVAAPVSRYTRLAWAEREATIAASQWIEHIRKGQRRAAHQWTLPLAARCPPHETLSHCYRHDPALQEELEAYVSRRQVRQMLLWGEQATYAGPTRLHRGLRGSQDEIDLAYRIDLARDDDPHRHDRFLHVFMRRRRDAQTGSYFWIVAGIRLAESISDSAH